MSFAEHAANGNALGVLRSAAITGSLWAVGISWATAIREVSLLLMPGDTRDAVFAEVLATAITTCFGVGIALVAGRKWCQDTPPPKPPPAKPQLAPSRR